MSDWKRNISAKVLGTLLGLAIAIGGWWVVARIARSLYFEDMVRAAVLEMVKPEALKELP